MTNAIVLNKTSNLVMPSHYIELDREEMAHVEGGDYFLSKETCQDILIGSGIAALIGGTTAVLLGGTALYKALETISLIYYLRKGIGLLGFGGILGAILCFVIEKAVSFVVGVIGGAANNGITIKTLKIFGFDTGIPTFKFVY